MKKTKGIVFAASVLCFWVMASLVIAAPQSSQPPSSGESVSVVFPDIGPVDARAYNMSLPDSPQVSGAVSEDVISITCDYFVSGCFEKKAFSNRVDIDGIRYYEQEYWLSNVFYKPDCYPGERQSYAFSTNGWTATPGRHTITCILDSKDDMAEGPVNELNNRKTLTLTVPLPAIDKIKNIKTKQPIPVPTPGVR